MDIRLDSIYITAHQREFPDSMDFWDGNFLVVTVIYEDDQNMIKIHGPYLHLKELSQFLNECEKLSKTLQGSAVLNPVEPNLRIELKANKRGTIQMKTNITPNPIKQKHEIIDEIDQSYLPDFITSLRELLEAYPIIGESSLNNILWK